MPTARPWPALVALVLLLWASGLDAQAVRGRVLEEGSERPLAGVFVVALDEQGRRSTGVLTDSTGWFLLRAPSPGTYRVVAELIGYAAAPSRPIELAAGSTAELTLHVSVRAIDLEGIEAVSEARCRRRPGSGPQTARLWEEARKALEITRWSQRSEVLRYELVTHRRLLDPLSLRVVEQEERPRSSYHTGSPYRAIDPARLDSAGYIQATPDGRFDYFAPDAEVLLSESFLADHCFHVAPAPADEPELVGLAFEPVPERDLPDVRGVLWLDRGTAELRRLDYRYTRLPYDTRTSWDAVGGRVEFERLATGVWIVRRWYIRMPRVVRRRSPDDPRGSLHLAGLDEVGAVVRRVYSPGGALLAEAVGGTVFGTVLDEAGDRPLEGATIRLVGTDRTTTAGEGGAYRFTELPAGTYVVRFEHPDLQALGLEPQERTVRVIGGRSQRLPLTVRLGAELAADLCEAGGWRDDQGRPPVLLHGRVTDPATGAGVPGAWVHIRAARAPEPMRRVVADDTGAYRLCLPPRGSVHLAAVPADAVFGDAPPGAGRAIEVASPGIVSVDVPVSRPAAAPRTGSRRSGWRSELVGVVRHGAAGDAVAGVLVRLSDGEGAVLDSATTDEQGRFRIPHPGEGAEFVLRAEHIGYAATASELAFPPSDRVEVEVRLTERAIELEPIVVTERRRGFLADMGYYDRREMGAGQFIERAEIERRAPAKITDLMRGRRGVQVVTGGFLGDDIRLTHQISFRTPTMSCQPAIWIDDLMVRRGGPSQPDDPRLSEVISPASVEAIELYSGTAGTPIRYGGTDAPCGAVIIWTRRGDAPADP